jgi:dynein heavy chain 1
LLNLWNADLLKNQQIVTDIINAARGEQILEDIVKDIKETWSKYDLDLIPYQSKCMVIKGFDELFQQIDEHINNIGSMRMS